MSYFFVWSQTAGRVDGLEGGGPAHKAGMEIGDVIMTVGDQKIFDLNQLESLLLRKSSKDTLKLTIFRRTKGNMEVKVTLEETPKNQELPIEDGLL
ncbi:MAG: PDZ domain-containing protein [Deltaproteobacteria bacterium]|nr:PDZ domain-containing protein [Deltaproteobacteria bacterium]